LWPGNVRELQHVPEGAMVLSDGVITPEHLAEWERRMILAALQQTHGVQARVAKILRVSQRSLGYRIETLGIPVRTPDEAPSA